MAVDHVFMDLVGQALGRETNLSRSPGISRKNKETHVHTYIQREEGEEKMNVCVCEDGMAWPNRGLCLGKSLFSGQ